MAHIGRKLAYKYRCKNPRSILPQGCVGPFRGSFSGAKDSEFRANQATIRNGIRLLSYKHPSSTHPKEPHRRFLNPRVAQGFPPSAGP